MRSILSMLAFLWLTALLASCHPGGRQPDLSQPVEPSPILSDVPTGDMVNIASGTAETSGEPGVTTRPTPGKSTAGTSQTTATAAGSASAPTRGTEATLQWENDKSTTSSKGSTAGDKTSSAVTTPHRPSVTTAAAETTRRSSSSTSVTSTTQTGTDIPSRPTSAPPIDDDGFGPIVKP